MNKTLTGKELSKAIDEWQKAGKPEALRNAISLSCLDLIRHALHVKGIYTDQGQDFNTREKEEIEQEAYLVFLECMERYDYSIGTSFTSYFYKYVQKVRRESNLYSQDKSLDEPLPSEEGENTTLRDTIEDESQQDPFNEIENKSEAKSIRNTLEAVLNKEEKKYLYSYYGIGGMKERNMREISELYQVSYNIVQTTISRVRFRLAQNGTLRDIFNNYESFSYLQSYRYGIKTGTTNNIATPTEDLAIKLAELKAKLEASIKKYSEINKG